MQRFVVYKPLTGLYMAPKAHWGEREGVSLDKARVFTTKGAARQAAKWWTKEPIDIQAIALAPTAPQPRSTPDFSGIIVLPFASVVEYFRVTYLADIASAKSGPFYPAPILPYLEAHNRFLGGLTNGDRIVIRPTDFESAHPLIHLFAEELVKVFGVDDEKGERFCLFEIDWKDEHGRIRDNY